MTVWIVSVNGFPRAACASASRAEAVMAEYRAQKPEEWRPVGLLGWSSPETKSLRAIEMAVV